MIAEALRVRLEPAARRQVSWRRNRALALCWVAAGLTGVALLALARWTGWTTATFTPLLACAGLAAAAGVLWQSRRWQPDYRELARRVEAGHPGLRHLVVTAVEQQPDPQTGRLNFLQERIVREAAAAGEAGQWREAVPAHHLKAMRAAQFTAMGVFALALTALYHTGSSGGPNSGIGKGVVVTPGDAQVERGSSIVIAATFTGRPPGGATLVIAQPASAQTRLPLIKNLDDPVFGGSIPEVTQDLVYYLEYDGGRTRAFKLTVFDYPRLERADAHLEFPTYTGLPAKRIENTQRLSAVEGSRVRLDLRFNKPVAAARLLPRNGPAIALTVESNQTSAVLLNYALNQSKVYELQLVDHEGRTNRASAQFTFDALKNRPPEIKLASPRGDVRVSPLEELLFQAQAWDDYGLQAYGFSYAMGGQLPRKIALGGQAPAQARREFQHLLALEDLAAQPSQLISFYIWAEDFGPDGAVRETASDMYLAEVRAFEEIFREGQSMDGQAEQEGQAGSENTSLAELQKQIIHATWKLQRTARGSTPPPQYNKDLPVVRDSQEKALTQARALRERAPATPALLALDAIEKAMQQAVDQLSQAAKSTAPLPAALAAEQAAYQALLKLSGRDFQVSQSRSGSGGASQRQQQQLNQLDLRENADRYETQRQAAPRQSPEQTEQLAVLNRLKELAQRQEDLNQQLKELQLALQATRSEPEREELQRRLKRLREEQQEILADADELQQRMQRPENQQRMADARRQLESTRPEIQRAAEALERDKVAQALTAGTRAERELRQARDEFRKQNSSQFAEEMRQLRQQARDLAQQQEAISRKLQSLGESTRKTLTGDHETKETLSQLQRQSSGLTNLLEQARGISERAEGSEPLLAKQLYEAYRKSTQSDLAEALTMTEELVKRGRSRQTAPFEKTAREEINRLKTSVEQAAESVLGDDVESLRLAEHELEDLGRQLEREMAQAAGGSTTDSVAANHPTEQPNPTTRERQETATGPTRPDPSTDNSREAKTSAGTPAPEAAGAAGVSLSSELNGQGQNRSTELAPSGSNQSGQGQALNRQADASKPEKEGARGQDLLQRFTEAAAENGERSGGPLTGPAYAGWSERLGNVEEMVEAADLRNEIARIRDRTRAMRAELKRHGRQPQWPLVRSQLIAPLAEVRQRIAEELARRQADTALAPIDRDPVPAKFAELVRKYYEQLGRAELPQAPEKPQN